MMGPRLSAATRRVIAEAFERLDYRRLATIYCYEGGAAFWNSKRVSCRRLGMLIGQALLKRLPPGGRSLYVGAGVAELPALLVESLDLHRNVLPCNLRRSEVAILNRACRGLHLRFHAMDAGSAPGTFDHLWIVSVFNDPERFPQIAALSYGRAVPLTFNPSTFVKERKVLQLLLNRCMSKLRLPGLVTTSVEEVNWIADWCHRHRIPYRVERHQFQTAVVGDPICVIRIGGNSQKVDKLKSVNFATPTF
jgi:hypothetical protein